MKTVTVTKNMLIRGEFDAEFASKSDICFSKITNISRTDTMKILSVCTVF